MNKEYNINTFLKSFLNPSKNVVIFCTSYPSVPIILSLFEILHNKGIKVELIVSNNDLYNFFKNQYSNYYRYITHAYAKPQYYIGLKKIWRIISEKIWLNKLKKQIHYSFNTNILFFARDFVSRDFYLLNYLKKQKNNSLYCIKISDLAQTSSANSFKNKIKILVLRFLYGKDLSLMKYSYRSPFTRIKDSFLSNVKIYHLNYEDIKRDFKTETKFMIANSIRVVYFDAPLFGKIRNKYLKTRVLKTVSKYLKSKNELGIKFHPGRIYDKGLLKYGIEIPRYIPSEIIHLNNCKLAIGFESYTLAKSNLNDIQGICLTYLESWPDKDLESKKINQMKFLNNDLLFPKSLDELAWIIHKKICFPI